MWSEGGRCGVREGGVREGGGMEGGVEGGSVSHLQNLGRVYPHRYMECMHLYCVCYALHLYCVQHIPACVCSVSAD